MKKMNINKSKMCCLVELYTPFELPKMNKIEFMSAFRCQGCGIKYDAFEGQVKAFINQLNENILLNIECEEQGYDETFIISDDILELYDMLV